MFLNLHKKSVKGLSHFTSNPETRESFVVYYENQSSQGTNANEHARKATKTEKKIDRRYEMFKSALAGLY